SRSHPSLFVLSTAPPPPPPPFPYPTPFRSERAPQRLRPAQREVMPAARSRHPPIQQVLLAVQPGVQRRVEHRLQHPPVLARVPRSEEHTSELQSLTNLVCRLLLEKKNATTP